MLTVENADALVEMWADVLVALVARYPGKRLRMWVRVPDAATAAARQSARLARWETDIVRMLGIFDPGSRADPLSIGGSVEALRAECRAWFREAGDADIAALRSLCCDTAAIVAAARAKWDERKKVGIAG